MTNLWNTPIDKLMLWSSTSWSKYDLKLSRNATLRVHYDQLLLISETKILESFNIRTNKIKGVYKGDVLILIVNVAGQQIRKLRFQLITDVALSLSRLGELFPVMSHNSLQSRNTISSKYRGINEIFKHALYLDNNMENTETVTSALLPSDYDNFIKLCLLDPAFPQIVSDIAKLLEDGKIK